MRGREEDVIYVREDLSPRNQGQGALRGCQGVAPGRAHRTIPHAVLLGTLSRDRDDYILHPETGERLSPPSIGELLFEKSAPGSLCGILHIIGERPGTMNHSYSACITVVKGQRRAEKNIDHDITKLVCNIADTALPPGDAARETLTIIRELAGKKVNGSRRRNHS